MMFAANMNKSVSHNLQGDHCTLKSKPPEHESESDEFCESSSSTKARKAWKTIEVNAMLKLWILIDALCVAVCCLGKLLHQ